MERWSSEFNVHNHENHTFEIKLQERIRELEKKLK